MRYELRLWTDAEKTNYIVKATADEEPILRAYMNRPAIPNEDWYRFHIVDTEENNNA